MDRERFDAVTRLFAASASRRAALGTLLGAGLTGSIRNVLAGNTRRNRKGKRKQRIKGSRPVTAQAVNCLSLGHGANVSGCDYTGEDHAGEDLSSSRMVGTIFRDATLSRTDLSSSAMKNAVFRNAVMCGADLRSSTVGGANFRDADLTLVTFKSSGGCNSATFTGGTTFCGTVMCDGTIRNDDCPGGPPAGLCCIDADCGTGQECQGNICCTTDPVSAIGSAAPGGTVRICAGTYRVVELTIDKNLTVIGAGAGVTVLDAEEDGRVLTVRSATVELRDLTITGGKVTGNGGGISNLGGLTLIGVTVRDNESTITGGGIVNADSSNLTLGTGTRIEFNSSALRGGGVTNVGRMTMQNGSRVENNTTPGRGGGIDNSPIGILTLQAGSRVENNTAGVIGGGIRNDGSATIDAGAIITGNSPDNCEPTIGTCT